MEKAFFEIVKFEVNDIITASTGFVDGGEGGTGGSSGSGSSSGSTGFMSEVDVFNWQKKKWHSFL